MSIYKSNNFDLEYFSYGDLSNSPIVLIPPGLGQASHFDDLVKNLEDKYFVITINLPGVGLSESESGELKDLALYISELLNKLEIKNPAILGESYGGSLAIEIDKLIKVKKLILLGSGEYFNPLIRFILKLLFLPALKSKVLRRSYAKLINPLGIFNFKEFSDLQLLQINKRWLSVLNYKINEAKSNTPVVYYLANKDIIVNKFSTKKLKEKFVQFKIYSVKGSHFEYEKRYLEAKLELI